MHAFTSDWTSLALPENPGSMKLLPRPPKNVRVNTEDSLGHGMDAVIMLAIFLGAGFGLDRLLGTMPIFMIVMTVVGSVGLFARFFYRYEAKMNEHDAQRLAKLSGPDQSSAAGGANGEAA
ncbi:MAG: AtpZ/AtpI family protein [Ilumatobacter sp.]|nr:AtpZ/AtpI family protein [bacterium]MDG2039447.1 AtpZ/AtpI family protein [Ilumatobacter sp.]